MTHVFIVDQNTFNTHLQYMFAGTGVTPKKEENKQKEKVLFFTNKNAEKHYKIEENLVGMVADISRIRKGDKIIFYLQQHNGCEGKFFGVFKAKSVAFFDENDENNYLQKELERKLCFRVEIEADEVYEQGISEHEYLDSLEGKEHPYEMCWSLIYRKLKGNRGCTMITDYEYRDLLTKLKNKNNNKTILGKNFKFNKQLNTIEKSDEDFTYIGRKDSLNIQDRMLVKAKNNKAFEVHLQAYIMQNYDQEPFKSLLFMNKLSTNHWIGNEVSCGVGMQRIDIMTIEEDDNQVYIRPIELKCIEAYKEIVTRQLPWYVKWCCDYIVPTFGKNKSIYIIPTILTKKHSGDFLGHEFKNVPLIQNITSAKILPIDYIEFDIKADKITINLVRNDNL